jgi:GT2 family glycosyltransferase
MNVSVIIPAFNSAATIIATVESALGQTLSDLEVIVVDDGSTDDTLARLSAIHDSRLRIIRATHSGVAHARNLGVEDARGEFLAFLDADDMWTADKLEAQVSALTADSEAGAAYSWTVFLDNQGRYLFAKEPQHYSGDVYAELLVTFFLAGGSNVLARRRCIDAAGRFDESAQPVEDWEYWLRVAKLAQFALVKRYQVLHRFTIGSASSAVEQYQVAIKRVAAKAFSEAPPGLRARQRECLSNANQHACLASLARTTAPEAHRRAGQLLREAIVHYPASLMSARMVALMGSWLVLCFVPRRKVADAARGLLRFYGRWIAWTTQFLSRLRHRPDLLEESSRRLLGRR